MFEQSTDNHGIDFVHKENDFIDFDREKLIFQMHSADGPRIGKGDVNGDGLEDFYICGAKDQPGALYIQTPGGVLNGATKSCLSRIRPVKIRTVCFSMRMATGTRTCMYVAEATSSRLTRRI